MQQICILISGVIPILRINNERDLKSSKISNFIYFLYNKHSLPLLNEFIIEI